MLLAVSMLIIVLSLSATCKENNPGMKVRIMENALEGGVQYFVDIMKAEMSTYSLPDVIGRAEIDSDEMKYELTQIQIVDFQVGDVSSKFVPGTGAQIKLNRASAVINCQCNLDSWLLKDSGSAVLTLSGTSIVMVLGVRRIHPGVPSMFMVDCQSNIENIEFKILSDISYVYDALKPYIEEVLKRSVTEQLCSALRRQVLRWDESCSNLPMNFTLSHNVRADLSLTSDPEICEKYAEFNVKGKFHVTNVTMMDYPPALFNLPAETSSRSCAGISEASLNSLACAYHSSGSLNDMLANASESVHLTTAELTAAVPETSQQFKSPTNATILLYATSCPKVKLQANNITMDFEGLFQIYVRSAEGVSQCVLEAKILAAFYGDVSISEAEGFQGLNVSASISLRRFQIDKTEPNSNGPKDNASEMGIENIFTQKLLPNIKENLMEGMLIPSRILKNPSSVTKMGYEQVEMTFNWS